MKKAANLSAWQLQSTIQPASSYMNLTSISFQCMAFSLLGEYYLVGKTVQWAIY